MEPLSLREAALRTTLSVTTLRRYIRSGRLRAQKQNGRFGPEYFVSEEDLSAAGLELTPSSGASKNPQAPQQSAISLERIFRDSVPGDMYRELQMKHEQLLVQYGMVRAAGLRVMESREEAETRKSQVEDLQNQLSRLKESHARDSDDLRRKARSASLEAEEARLEAAALREKVRALEILTRNAVTTETIDRKFEQILSQSRRIERIEDRFPSSEPLPPATDAPDH